eukprot:5753485-Ditylum_brightwellii.AAC.1
MLLSNSRSTLAQDLQTYWTRLQHQYQHAVGHHKEEGLNHIIKDVQSIGTYDTGKPPPSVTHKVD